MRVGFGLSKQWAAFIDICRNRSGFSDSDNSLRLVMCISRRWCRKKGRFVTTTGRVAGGSICSAGPLSGCPDVGIVVDFVL